MIAKTSPNVFNGGVNGSGLLLLEGFSRCRPEPG
jgi:hypothetical protein